MLAAIMLMMMIQGYLIPFNPPAAGGVNCGSNTGNLFSETFDQAGYDEVGNWTEFDPDECTTACTWDDDDTTNPPLTGDCFDTKQMEFIHPNDPRIGLQGNWVGDVNDDVWFRIYVASNFFQSVPDNRVSHFLMADSPDEIGVATTCSTGWDDPNAMVLFREKSGGTPAHLELHFQDGGGMTKAENSAEVSSDVMELFRVELHVRSAGTDLVGWKVHNMTTDVEIANAEFTTDVVLHADGTEGITIGACNGSASHNATNTYFDYVDVSDEGYIGE